MKITHLEAQSFNDYPGKISSVVLTSGCNFACPTCHSRKVVYGDGEISEKKVFDYLLSRGNWIDGLVLCGGEPTLQEDLIDFIEKSKILNRDLYIKLDTNGSNPRVVENLIEKRLVDYIALDIKADETNYPIVTGRRIDLKKIEESIKVVTKAPDYEYRTTIVPIIREEDGGEIRKMSYMDAEEATRMRNWVYRIVGGEAENIKWIVQKFVAREEENKEMLDERFSKENLEKLELIIPTPRQKLEEVRDVIKECFPNCKIRGDES